MKVRTRIAPSPTGKFHIGTARTALFNCLFAKKNGGDFLLRFEDTDRERSTKEFEDDIREGLKWLGMDWDEEYKQMDRLDIYKKYADRLIEKGFARRKNEDGSIWFKAKEFVENKANEYKIQNLGSVDVFTKFQSDSKLEKKREGLIIKLEDKDIVLGEITGIVEDFVIIRANGIPIYHFAVVVDDHDMKITHVIRGQDHFGNTPKQVLLQKALGFETPIYAHIPLILNEDKSKLSKRKNATSVTEYREKGYLSEAIVNFLALLGWNPGDEREYFNLNELIKEFSLERVQKSPAIFNIEKLNSINSHYIKDLGTEELKNEITKTSSIVQKMDDALFEKAVIITKDRLKYLSELDELTSFLVEQPDYDPQILIFKKSTKKNTSRGLAAGSRQLAAMPDKDWDNQEKLNEVLSSVVSENGLDNGDVFWPVRVALSGLEKSPSPTELLWTLGKEESLNRTEKAIKKLQQI